MHSVERQQHAAHGSRFHAHLLAGLLGNGNVHVLLRCGKFVLHGSLKGFQVGFKCLLFSCRNRAHSMPLTWNGIVQTTALNVNQPQIELLHFVHQEAHKQFVGIGPLLVDVVTRVAAGQTLDGYLESEIVRWHLRGREVVCGSGSYTTSTAHVQLSLVLRVEVDEIVAMHKIALHAYSPRQASFLISRKYALDRSVLNVVRFQYGHFHGHANAIVGTKRCAFSFEPFAVNVGLYGIVFEVECHVLILFAHHVHVALQNDSLAVLISRCGRLANANVARFIYLSFQSEALAKRL